MNKMVWQQLRRTRRFEIQGLPGLVDLMNHSSVKDFLMRSSPFPGF